MWILSEAAINDLDIMAAWGARAFGLRQSEHYERRIVDMFDALATNPEMAPEKAVPSGLVRVMPCGSHYIVYRLEGGDIAIVRVLHHFQRWPQDL